MIVRSLRLACLIPVALLNACRPQSPDTSSRKLESVAVRAPLGGDGRSEETALSLPPASGASDGYLTAKDWAAFDAKISASDPRLSDSRVPAGAAVGDLSGSYPAPRVARLMGTPLSSALPVLGQSLVFDGSVWTPRNPLDVDVRNFGAKGDGVADDTAAIVAAIAGAPAGAAIRFPPGIYQVSAEIPVKRTVSFQGDGATLRFSFPFNDGGTGRLGMFDVSAPDVVFDKLGFDGSLGSGVGRNTSRFVWFGPGAHRGVVRNCSFVSLPAQATGFQGAVGFGNGEWEGEAHHNRFYGCPGAVFAQGARVRIHDNVAVSPKDASFTLNGPNCVGGSVSHNQVFNPGGTVSVHIAIEEGASAFSVVGNYVRGVTNLGISCLTVAYKTPVSGGLIANNVVDGGAFALTSASSLISVGTYYRDVLVAHNSLTGVSTGNASSTALTVSAAGNVVMGNIIRPGVSTLGAVLVTPAGGFLRLSQNDISEAGSGRGVYVFAGDNAGVPLVASGNWYRNASEGINVAAATNMPLYIENEGFDAVANPINGTPWQDYFNVARAYRFPHSIREAKVLRGGAPPTTGAWAQGDRIVNAAPVELGAVGSRYVVDGWACTVAGTPGTWVEQRTLTGG